MKPNELTGSLLDWRHVETVDVGGENPVDVWENPKINAQIVVPENVKPTLEIIYGQLLAKQVSQPEPQYAVQAIEDDESAVDRISIMLQGSKSGARSEVKVYRIKPDNTENFCSSYKPEDFENGDLSLIQKQFGGGVYKIKVYATDPVNNKFRLYANQKVEIEQPLTDLSKPVVENNNGMHTLFEKMLNRMDNMEQRFINAQTPAQPVTMEGILQQMVMMKQVLGSNEPKSSVTELLEGLKQMREMSDLINPSKSDRDESDGLLPLASQAMDLIKGFSQPVNDAPVQNQIAHVPVNRPVNTRPIQNDIKIENENENKNDDTMMIKFLLKTLKSKSANNEDVVLVADALAPMIPEAVWEMLEADDWFDKLCEFDTECLPHKNWFTKLHDELLNDEIDNNSSTNIVGLTE
jgi:hypothetical protein